MAVNKVQKSNGDVLIDISDTTAIASDVARGKYFYGADGVKTVGTNTDADEIEDSNEALGNDGTASLSDAIAALTTYANETTGESDTTLSDAVGTLVDGYGGGGASTFVHGEFHTNSAYGQQVITIPYTGTGYAIMATIVVKGGAYVSGTTWYDAISRYAIGAWSMTKSNMSLTPAQETYAVVQSLYKNSTSSATSYTRNSAMNQNTFQNNASASANGCVVFQNPTTMRVYVQNTSYGLLKNIDYEYFIVYSS